MPGPSPVAGVHPQREGPDTGGLKHRGHHPSPRPVPAFPRANATEVLAETSGTVGSAPVIVIGVNPSSFENGAFWDSSYSGQPLGHLMQALAAAPAFGHTIPVIAGGPAGFSLRPGLLLPYSTPAVARPVRVVGTATTVPGQNGSDPILIMKRSELARLDPAAYDQIWSKDAATEVTAALRSTGIGFTSVQSATTVLGQIQFAPLHWTFQALQALGVLVGLLALRDSSCSSPRGAEPERCPTHSGSRWG